jgi:hypothetical protein
MPIQTVQLEVLESEIKAAFEEQKKNALSLKRNPDGTIPGEEKIISDLAAKISLAIDSHIKRTIVLINPGIVITGALTPAGAVAGTTVSQGTS